MAATYDKYKTLREVMQQTLKGKGELLYSQGCNISGFVLRKMVLSLKRFDEEMKTG